MQLGVCFLLEILETVNIRLTRRNREAAVDLRLGHFSGNSDRTLEATVAELDIVVAAGRCSSSASAVSLLGVHRHGVSEDRLIEAAVSFPGEEQSQRTLGLVHIAVVGLDRQHWFALPAPALE